MASAEDQAAAAALLGGDPAAFDALLSTLMSASNADRAGAEAAFHWLRKSHPETLALRLASALSAPATPADFRAMAAVLLRKLLSPTPSSDSPSAAPAPLWPHLTPAGQAGLQSHLLSALKSDPPKPIAKKVCDVISELAVLLLPENTWTELLPFLFRAASTPEAPSLQESALLIFARLADNIAESLLDHLMTIHNLLASALAHPTSPDVRIAAPGAAVNLVQCLPTNADRDKMQDLLPAMMRALTECLNSAQEASAQEALELLVELAGAEPRFLRPHITDVAGAMLQIADAHVLETNADHVAHAQVADTNADHVADARVVDTTDDVTNAITMFQPTIVTDLESIYSVAGQVTTALEVSGGHDQGGNNNDVRITVDQSIEPEPEDVPLLARKLVTALLTVGIATMGADISTVLHRPANGLVFGHNKLAYFLILVGIFAAGAAEVMTAIWLARSGAPDGRHRRFSFARAAICASIVPFVAVVGINSTMVMEG